MGDTLGSISKQYGQFPKHIIKKAGLDEKNIIVVATIGRLFYYFFAGRRGRRPLQHLTLIFIT